MVLSLLTEEGGSVFILPEAEAKGFFAVGTQNGTAVNCNKAHAHLFAYSKYILPTSGIMFSAELLLKIGRNVRCNTHGRKHLQDQSQVFLVVAGETRVLSETFTV